MAEITLTKKQLEKIKSDMYKQVEMLTDGEIKAMTKGFKLEEVPPGA